MKRAYMSCSRAKSPTVSVIMLVGIVTILAGCAAGFYGWRPDQIEVDLSKAPAGDPYPEYIRVRQFAIQMTEAYDSRSGFNRGSVYAGSTALLGLTAASSGLAAFGAAASAGGESLPIVSTFVNGLFGIFDSRQLSQAYTTGANKLRRAVSESDAAFLQEPVMDTKWRKVAALQERVLDIISEVEEARNNALPDPKKTVERAIKAKDEVEEALSIKPKITSIGPRVVPLDGWKDISIRGSGFDSVTTVTVSGKPAKYRFVSEGEIKFDVDQEQRTTEHSVVARNRFNREAGSSITLVQARLKVKDCKVLDRPKEPDKLVVVLVVGEGFQEDAEIEFIAKIGDKDVVKDRKWQAHTQWQVQLDNSLPGKIEVSKVAVKNPRPTDGKPEELASAKEKCSISARQQ